MNVKDISNTIVKIGICHYGIKEYRVFICESNIFPGTGDYEDDIEIREDRLINCYCIWFENMISIGEISSGGGYYENLEDAICSVESSVEFYKWLT